MSDERMSFDDAKAFVEKLQEENVKPSTIRRQMVDKGFSYAEIYELSGEAEETRTEQVKVEADKKEKTKKYDDYVEELENSNVSDERMSFDDAKAFVEKLQEQNVKPSTIRRQMVDKGFSYAEIYELSGEAEQAESRKPKPKRHYGKRKNSIYGSSQQEPEQFERGGCLTAYLSLQLIVTALAFFLVCITMTQISSVSANQSGFVMIIVVMVLIVSGLQLACINALWEGKAWGYQGLLGLLFLSAILNLITGDIAQLGGNIGGVAILMALVNPKSHLLS